MRPASQSGERPRFPGASPRRLSAPAAFRAHSTRSQISPASQSAPMPVKKGSSFSGAALSAFCRVRSGRSPEMPSVQSARTPFWFSQSALLRASCSRPPQNTRAGSSRAKAARGKRLGHAPPSARAARPPAAAGLLPACRQRTGAALRFARRVRAGAAAAPLQSTHPPCRAALVQRFLPAAVKRSLHRGKAPRRAASIRQTARFPESRSKRQRRLPAPARPRKHHGVLRFVKGGGHE